MKLPKDYVADLERRGLIPPKLSVAPQPTPRRLFWPPLAPERVLLSLTVRGEPVPKGRPRFANGHAYTPARTRRAEIRLAGLLRREFGARRPFAGPVGCRVAFALPVTPGRRADVDNFVKSVLDAGNEIVYRDDRQVLEVHARILLRQPEPYTEVAFYRL